MPGHSVYDWFMGKDPEHRLLERLARVEALHSGATTPGERAAAAKARERVAARLIEARASDATRQFCRAYVWSLGVEEERRDRPPRPLPSPAELAAQLSAWEADELSDHELLAWASEVVDQVLLPRDPDHEGACRAEVLLQLASRDLGRLTSTDVPLIRRFLRTRDWESWFALLATAARRRQGA